MKYNLTAETNIGVGFVDAREDKERLERAANRSLADAFITKFPLGYAQILGRGFNGGLDLSGGEWQRIALARAYFRNAEILVLDEPTAALDARSEAEVVRRILDLSSVRTSLLISHRYSTARLADRIVVIEAGEIIENGSHQELISLGGRYCELYEMQAAAFQ